VPTDGGKEDHVSMGMTAATKLRSVVNLLEQVIAIELITAAEGLEHRKPLAPGLGVKQAYEIVRTIVAPLANDRSMSGDIQKVIEKVRNGEFDALLK
jgi:histidine ammonia-lyase